MTLQVQTSSLPPSAATTKMDVKKMEERVLLHMLLFKKRRRVSAKTLEDTIQSEEFSSDFIQDTSESSSACSSCMKYRTQSHSVAHSFDNHKGTKSVSFADVSVHLHEITLGDNPSVTSGPPLTIGWKPFFSKTVPLDSYETSKPPARVKQEMLVPRVTREDWLRDAGFARGVINETVKEVTVIRENRAKSARDSRLREAIVSWKRVTRRSSTDKLAPFNEVSSV